MQKRSYEPPTAELLILLPDLLFIAASTERAEDELWTERF